MLLALQKSGLQVMTILNKCFSLGNFQHEANSIRYPRRLTFRLHGY